MKPGIVTLEDGTLVAFMTEDAKLTTKEGAAYAVLTYPNGDRVVAVRSQPSRDGSSTIREG